MRQWLIIIGLLLLLLAGGYFVIFKMIAPKAARVFIPSKWQNVPLGQKKAVVYDYLGEPDTIFNGKDRWEEKLSSVKKYVLEVRYRGDTVSGSYRVTYEVNYLGFEQVTEVRADSVKQ